MELAPNPQARHRSPVTWHKIVLLGDRGNLPTVALESAVAGIRTRDLLIATPAPYR